MEHEITLLWVSVLAIGTVLVAVCQRLDLSPILGYLVTGFLVGPAGLGWLSDGPTIRLLAELGVVLLLFTIGLEFSLPRLLAAKRLVLGLGGAQVLVTASLLGLGGAWLGLSLTEALVIGVALAMSSTAIVLKQLSEQLELAAPHGRVATGILLFQDIVAVPVLVVLPILAADPAQLGSVLAFALVKAALVFVGLVLVGRYLLPPVLHWVAGTGSLELFMLMTLLVAMAAAAVSILVGLSPTLGAFMAGMLLGETLFRHQVEADIRPFRDIMLGLFFASIGMQLVPVNVISEPLTVGLVTVALLLIKPLILAPMVRFMGYHRHDAGRAAISLAQGGEFGLLVLASALSLGLVSGAIAQPVLGGIVVSMVIAPVLLRFNQPLVAILFRRDHSVSKLDPEAYVAEVSRNFDQHVIICGYGRLGQNVLRILTEASIPCLALDLDTERVRQAAAVGEPVLFGNAAQPGILHAAGIERARALAITIDAPAMAERIVSQTRALGLEGLPILVRSCHGRHDASLTASGAEVFPEGMETSLAFAGQLLIMLDVPSSQVEARLSSIRAEHYAPLRLFFHASDEAKAKQQEQDYPEQVQAVFIADGHYAAGRTLSKLQAEQHGVQLLDVRRGAMRVPGRLLDTHIRPGDVLLLKGRREALDIAVAMLTDGV